MRLILHSTLLGAAIAATIPVRQLVPVKPTISTITKTVGPQPTAPISYWHRPVNSHVPEAISIQARDALDDPITSRQFLCMVECLQPQRPYIEPIEPRFSSCRNHCSEEAEPHGDGSHPSSTQALDDPDLRDNRYLLCMHRCIENDVIPPNKDLKQPALAECRRRCKAVSGPKTAGDDDDDDDDVEDLASAILSLIVGDQSDGALADPLQAPDASPDTVVDPLLGCIRECLKAKDQDVTPASSGSREKPAIAACRRQCSAAIGPQTAADDDDDVQDLASAILSWLDEDQDNKEALATAIQAREPLPEPRGPRFRCMIKCFRDEKDEGKRDECLRKCPGRRKPETKPGGPPPASPIEAREALPEPKDPELWCTVKCHRMNKDDEAGLAKCLRKCPRRNKPKPKPGPGGRPPPASAIEPRDASPEAKDDPVLLKVCFDECGRGPKKHIDGCKKWCNAAWKSPRAAGGDTTLLRKCYWGCANGPVEQRIECPKWCRAAWTPPMAESSSSSHAISITAEDPSPDAVPGRDLVLDPELHCKFTQCVLNKTLHNPDEKKACLRRCAATHGKGNETIASSSNNQARDAPAEDPVLGPVVGCKIWQCIFNETIRDPNEKKECLRRCGATLGKGNETLAISSSVQAQGPPPAYPAGNAEEQCQYRCIFVGNILILPPDSDDAKACFHRCSIAETLSNSSNKTITNSSSSIQARHAMPQHLIEDPVEYCKVECLSVGTGRPTPEEIQECSDFCTRPTESDEEPVENAGEVANPVHRRDPTCVIECVSGLPVMSNKEVAACKRRCAGVNTPYYPKGNETVSRPGVNMPYYPKANETFTPPYLKTNETVTPPALPGHKEEAGRPEGLVATAAADTPPACMFDCMQKVPNDDPEGRRGCLRHCRPMPLAGQETSTHEARDARHPEGPFCGDPECRHDCFKRIPPESTEERIECLGHCCPADAQENTPHDDEEDAAHRHPGHLAEGRVPPCVFECIKRLPANKTKEDVKACRRCTDEPSSTSNSAQDAPHSKEGDVVPRQEGIIWSPPKDGTRHPHGGVKGIIKIDDCPRGGCETVSIGHPPHGGVEDVSVIRNPHRGGVEDVSVIVNPHRGAVEDVAWFPPAAAAAATVEKRDCGSDCISNTRSKPELTACWKECQDRGELHLEDPTTTTTTQQKPPAAAATSSPIRAESRHLLGKREPKCTSKCLRGPPKTPKERHDCIRHCVRRSLD